MDVELKERSVDWYRPTIGDEVDKIKELSKPLKGMKILHVNATCLWRWSC